MSDFIQTTRINRCNTRWRLGGHDWAGSSGHVFTIREFFVSVVMNSNNTNDDTRDTNRESSDTLMQNDDLFLVSPSAIGKYDDNNEEVCVYCCISFIIFTLPLS